MKLSQVARLKYLYRELAEVPHVSERGDPVMRSRVGGHVLSKHCGVVRLLAHVNYSIVTLK